MSEGKEKKRPSHRLVMQHDPDNSKNQTEIGALWPHKQGGGFSVTLRRGLAILQLQDVRIHAFTIEDDKAKGGD